MSRKFLVPIDLSQNELQNARIQNLASAPSTPVTGQIYYNSTSNKTFYWNGTAWVDISVGTTYTNGSGLTLTTNTFAIDPAYASFTNYYTKTQIDAGYQPLDGDLTAIAALAGTSGFLKKTGTNTWTLDTATYLTGNQTITLSGDASGSGTTAITVSITDATVTGKLLTGFVAGANTAIAATDSILAALQKVQGQINARLSAEADTLATVTGRGATTSTAVTFTNATANTLGTAASGAVQVTGGVGVGGNVTVGGDLQVKGGDVILEGAAATIQGQAATLTSVNLFTGLSNASGKTINLGTGGTGGAVSVNIGGVLNAQGALNVAGDLTVNGTTTTVNSTVTTLDDPVITLGGDTAPVADDSKDRGVEFRWHNGSVAKVGFFGFDDSTGKFTFIPDATNTSEVFSGAKGILDATILGADVSGAVATASALGTARSITQTGDVSWTVNFDGSANVSAAASISAATVTGKALTGLTIPAASDIVATDTILQAFGKLQAQLDAVGTGSVNKYAVSFGDGSSLNYTITHNLNTRDVTAIVRLDSGTYATVECDIEMTTVNTLTLRFTVAPTANQYRVIVTG
jgi:hypothetical protein